MQRSRADGILSIMCLVHYNRQRRPMSEWVFSWSSSWVEVDWILYFAGSINTIFCRVNEYLNNSRTSNRSNKWKFWTRTNVSLTGKYVLHSMWCVESAWILWHRAPNWLPTQKSTLSKIGAQETDRFKTFPFNIFFVNSTLLLFLSIEIREARQMRLCWLGLQESKPPPPPFADPP